MGLLREVLGISYYFLERSGVNPQIFFWVMEVKMRKVLRAIGKALKRTFRRMRSGIAWTAGAIDGFFSGLLGGGGFVDEPEEDFIEDGSADEIVEDAARPVLVQSLGKRVKAAVDVIDRGRCPHLAFDMSDPVQASVAAWMTGLSQSALSTLRHAPIAAIERHLDVSDPWRCAGLPIYAANGNAPSREPEALSFSFREIDAVDETAAPQRAFG